MQETCLPPKETLMKVNRVKKVTPEGMVKVLDFGLAKALAEPASSSVT